MPAPELHVPGNPRRLAGCQHCWGEKVHACRHVHRPRHRPRTLPLRAAIAVVRFGDKYRQWNGAFDAGDAAALGKALMVWPSTAHRHALEEVDAAALAVTVTPAQVVEILGYVLEGSLPGQPSRAGTPGGQKLDAPPASP
jgi:hypothetical protein